MPGFRMASQGKRERYEATGLLAAIVTASDDAIISKTLVDRLRHLFPASAFSLIASGESPAQSRAPDRIL